METPDVRIENHGTIARIIPETEAAREWIAENVACEPWQYFGGSLCSEPRYVQAIIDGMEADSLTVGLEKSK